MARWVRQAGISQQCVCCVLSQRESFWVECGLDPIEPFRVRVVLTPNPLVWCGEFVVFLHFMNPCGLGRAQLTIETTWWRLQYRPPRDRDMLLFGSRVVLARLWRKQQ